MSNNISSTESTITLRKMDLSDLNKVVQFCFSDPKRTKESSTNFITNIVTPHPWFKAICIDNKPIGSISIEPSSKSNRRKAELGYALGVEYWNKGIGTLVVKMVVSSIFKEWVDLERLEALVHVENFASHRVLGKVGFMKEADFRKYLVFKGRCYDLVMYFAC